ncbi:MAG: hypothetical protein QW331_03895 [Candidatus Woesearchaeota archaeon]
MAFVRKKKIKGKEYAYLVENKWTEKGSRQKVKAYLGKVLMFPQVKNLELKESEKKDEFIKNLVEWELLKHGFEKQGNLFVQNNVKVLFENNKLKLDDSDVEPAFAFNEGYLCNYFLDQLFSLKLEKKDKQKPKTMMKVAKLFVNSGINIPQEAFIKFYDAIFMHK